ncbi:MAG: transferrin-binding protein-like solute binding protein [Pseudomonadota bacterium]
MVNIPSKIHEDHMDIKNLLTSIFILPALFIAGLLTGCGGGGSGVKPSTGGGTVTSPSYENMSSTADATSTLAGSGIRSNGTSGAIDLVNTSGSLKHDTGATTLNDGTYTLTDSDGFNASNVMSDGSSTLTSDGTQGFSGTYEYVRAYNQTYISGGVTYDTTGIYGIATNASDMPTSGSATYTGEATGVVVTATQGFGLSSGTSTVNADFGAGTVNVTLNGFTATDQATGNAATAPIDTISVNGMTISGNGFSGGTATTSNGGTTTSVTGANTTSNPQGHFFGYDSANSRPDEVGGNVLIQGDDGRVIGTFIAD